MMDYGSKISYFSTINRMLYAIDDMCNFHFSDSCIQHFMGCEVSLKVKAT